MICIPSFNRVETLRNKTLTTLKDVPHKMIYIFCVKEEFEEYKSLGYQTIIGVKGITNQRNFIYNYFPKDTKIIFMDDDISGIYKMKERLNPLTFFNEAFEKAGNRLWGINPNSAWLKDTETNDLRFCIGCLYGLTTNNIILNPLAEGKEDYENTILHFNSVGIYKFNGVFVRTKYRAKGGLGEERPNNQIAINYLKQIYPNVVRDKKQGEIRLIRLPFILPDICQELYKELQKITIPIKQNRSNRRGFPKHRATTFGISRARYSGKIGSSWATLRWPHIWKLIQKLGNYLHFEFTSVQLNHNVTCPPHKDTNNVCNSFLISFGKYTGGEIVINGETKNAYHNPIIFNGYELEHYNLPHDGEKYSLIFFNMPKKLGEKIFSKENGNDL
jgi:hypothetical protein